MSKRILIIGGGFTGLTAAYQLSRDPDLSVTVVESGPQLGGLAAGFPLLGTSLEKAYHHLFLTDTAILGLVDQLGLGEQLMWCDSSMAIYYGGRLYPFMSPMDVLRFKPCSFAGRLRIGLTVLYLKWSKNWRRFIGQTAYGWMRRACGRSAMDTVWGPLLKGKFDRYHDKISMAWLWARIHIRANSRGRGGGREQLGYFRGGFNIITQALEKELRARGVQIHLDTTIDQLRPGSAMIGGREFAFDQCIFTGPSTAFARLLPPGPVLEDYRRKLSSIDYLGAMCLVFTSEQDIGESYWVNVNEPDAPFLVFINHTRLVDKTHYQGSHVYYIGAYVPTDSPRFGLSDDALTELWWAYLKKMFPAFDPAKTGERHVFRFKAAQHIVDTAYEEKIPSYETPLPGVFLANFSQVFPEDRGTNFAVREGFRIAERIRREADKANTR